MIEIPDSANSIGHVTLYRSPEVQRDYDKLRHTCQEGLCAICRLIQEEKLGSQVIDMINGVSVVKNTFGYNTTEDWADGAELNDHLMIVPNAHVARLSDMSPEAKANLVDVWSDAMDEYDVSFVRRSGSRASSIDSHFHLHIGRAGRLLTERFFSTHRGINLVGFEGDPPLQ